MKFVAKYFLGVVLVVLSAFVFRVDDSATVSYQEYSVNGTEMTFSIASIASHNDVVVPDNTINLTSNVRRISNNNLLYRPYFTKEQNEFNILQPICQYSTNLSNLNKPQSFYYIYTLHKIRI